MSLLNRIAPASLLAARLIVGAIFLIAALTKVGAPGDFANAVRAYHILPSALVLPFALIVPWLELLVAAYLLSGFLSWLGAIGAIVLLVSFVIALSDALITGSTAHACGCFGSAAGTNPLLTFLAGGNTITWWDPVRDLILIALSALILWRGPGALSIDGLLARRREEDRRDRFIAKRVNTR
jgi:uncharacterized membrane protein YphA (DoxX/SURF4 family)